MRHDLLIALPLSLLGSTLAIVGGVWALTWVAERTSAHRTQSAC